MLPGASHEWKDNDGEDALYDQNMALPAINDDRGYPEPLSTGLLAQWVKTSWDKTDEKLICSSWEKAGLLFLLDGSGKKAWVRTELNSNAQGNLPLLHADVGEERRRPEDDLL